VLPALGIYPRESMSVRSVARDEVDVVREADPAAL
jgi:hypothetical protein